MFEDKRKKLYIKLQNEKVHSCQIRGVEEYPIKSPENACSKYIVNRLALVIVYVKLKSDSFFSEFSLNIETSCIGASTKLHDS